jgi:2-polyprenyl-3-methyl-5-hydroxy-6-metoxy-1,4-benzoquinol methylase
MYSVHEFQWNDASVERFWNYYARQTKISYFAQQVGGEVLHIAQQHIPINGVTLDYGCGKGHLIEVMLNSGLSNIYGADFSKESVEHVKKSNRFKKGFQDAYILTQLPAQELKTDFFDSVFLLETIEHLIPPYLDETISELSRIIKKEGYVVVTTPSNEDLETEKVLCPNCGAHFHRVQHVNSFSEDSILQLMNRFGFKKVYCESIHLEGYFTLRKKLARGVKNILKIDSKGVNLVYIGQKR